MADIPVRVMQIANDLGSVDKNRYLNAWKKKGFRSKVTAKCCDCVGFEDTVIRIKECTIEICPLHQARPFQPKS